MHKTLLAGFFLVAATSWGAPTGAIMGFAKDPSGAFVPGVKVTLTRAATNEALRAATEGAGAYHFPQLAPGVYSLRAEAAGFKILTIGSILVEVDQITRADLQLEVGAVTESVEVSAAATPLLEPDKSTLSHVVGSLTISNMPLNNRQFLDLALLTPGVVPALIIRAGKLPPC